MPKFGIDAPWYDGPVERAAFNLYAMSDSLIDDVINYINRYDEEDLEAACRAVDCPYDWALQNLDRIAEGTGANINYD